MKTVLNISLELDVQPLFTVDASGYVEAIVNYYEENGDLYDSKRVTLKPSDYLDDKPDEELSKAVETIRTKILALALPY